MKKFILILISCFAAFLFVNQVEAADEYSCPNNYTLVGTACINATKPSFRSVAYCAEGTGTLKSGACILQSAATPKNSSTENPSNNSDYSCESGYELIGRTCIKFHGAVTERQGSTYCDPNSNTTKVGYACILSKAATKQNTTPTTQPENPSDDSDNDDNENNYATSEDFLGDLTCGGTEFKFHKSLPNFTSVIYNLLKIATPVIIIITGMLDFLQAVSAQKEDEIKKSQQKFLRRLLAGAVVFLVFIIVETAIHAFAEGDQAENAMDCVDCFLGGAEKCD